MRLDLRDRINPLSDSSTHYCARLGFCQQLVHPNKSMVSQLEIDSRLETEFKLAYLAIKHSIMRFQR